MFYQIYSNNKKDQLNDNLIQEYFDNHKFSRTYFGKNLSSDEASKYEFDNFIKGNTQS